MTPDHHPRVVKLNAKQERFAQLVALGMTQADAYRKATKTKAKPEAVHVNASKWAAKVRIRIGELRGAAQARADDKYVYDYQDAMREADEAMAIARGKDDAKAMATIIALKGKFSGLETDPRKNERDPFREMTDDDLVALVNRNMEEAGLATLQ